MGTNLYIMGTLELEDLVAVATIKGMDLVVVGKIRAMVVEVDTIKVMAVVEATTAIKEEVVAMVGTAMGTTVAGSGLVCIGPTERRGRGATQGDGR